MATVKQPRQKTRPAAKTPRLRGLARSKLQDKLTEVTHELTEVTRHRAAISEVLRAIAGSPHDLQPIFDTILDAATHLCRADGGTLRLIEKEGVRLVARKVSPAVSKWVLPPTIAERGSYLGRSVTSGRIVHVPDIAVTELYYEGEPTLVAAVKGGIGTILFVPMLRNDDVIGALGIWRQRVEPFTDKQIELVTDFAAQAAIALEITRRERQYREAQTELAHANRLLTMGQLTASMAHELRQPLGAVLNDGKASLNWLTRHPPEVEEAKLCLEEAIKDVNRASDVIERIHRLVKKDTRRMEKLDINDAILEVISLIHGEVIKNGVTVGTELAETLPRIQGDRVQLQQVILNLLINAMQAMGDLAEGQRELHVSTASIEPEGVRVAVRDTGPGLRPQDLERLFAPFYTTKPNGMGMGLPICQSIIEDHGGRLWATRHEPRGALFQFTIPATSGGS
jgi:signal transduction histidine kinase